MPELSPPGVVRAELRLSEAAERQRVLAIAVVFRRSRCILGDRFGLWFSLWLSRCRGLGGRIRRDGHRDFFGGERQRQHPARQE